MTERRRKAVRQVQDMKEDTERGRAGGMLGEAAPPERFRAELRAAELRAVCGGVSCVVSTVVRCFIVCFIVILY